MLTWQIGDVRITQIVELTTASLGPYLLPQATPEALDAIDWIWPFVDAQQRIVLSIHALVLETRDQCIVVDTCIGNDKERTYPRWNRMQGRFLDDFVERGFALDRVDTVLCTHMHVDHVGWNTRLVDGRWEPTFRERALSVCRKGVAALEPRTAGIRSGHRRLGATDLRSRLSGSGWRNAPRHRRNLSWNRRRATRRATSACTSRRAAKRP